MKVKAPGEDLSPPAPQFGVEGSLEQWLSLIFGLQTPQKLSSRWVDGEFKLVGWGSRLSSLCSTTHRFGDPPRDLPWVHCHVHTQARWPLP